MPPPKSLRSGTPPTLPHASLVRQISYLSLRLVPAPLKEMELFNRTKAQHVRRYKQPNHLTNLEPHPGKRDSQRPPLVHPPFLCGGSAIPMNCELNAGTARTIRSWCTPTLSTERLVTDASRLCSQRMTTLREVKGGATRTAERQSGPGLDSSAFLLQTQQLRPWEQQRSGKASSLQAAAPLKGDISPLGPTTHVGTCHSYPLAKTSEVFSAVQELA